LLGFGSLIRISVFKKWTSELEEFLTGQPSSDPTAPDLILLSDVEEFSLGGEPAFRFIHLIEQDQIAFEYQKIAWTLYQERLYMFSYMDIADLDRCSAPPLSEDEVFEQMLTTVEFLK
jgi:hypothetical protein